MLYITSETQLTWSVLPLPFKSVVLWTFYSQNIFKGYGGGWRGTGNEGWLQWTENPHKRSVLMSQGQLGSCSWTRQEWLGVLCQDRTRADSRHRCERGQFLHHPPWWRNTSPFPQGCYSAGEQQETLPMRLKAATVQKLSQNLNRNI